MIYIKEIKKTEVQLCYELDLNSIGLWSKDQWSKEFNKSGVKIFALFLSSRIIGVSVVQVVIDEAQINYFSIDKKFRRKRYGSFLMRYLIEHFKLLKLKKILLEVSETNLIGRKFYNQLDFITVGKRRNYYRDNSNALLKEKKLIKY